MTKLVFAIIAFYKSDTQIYAQYKLHKWPSYSIAKKEIFQFIEKYSIA